MKNSGEAWDVKHAKNLDFSRKNGIFQAPEKVGENELSPLLSGRSRVRITSGTAKNGENPRFLEVRHFDFNRKSDKDLRTRLAG